MKKIILILLFGLVLIVGCVPQEVIEAEGDDINVELSAFKFNPNTITIKKGQETTFTLTARDIFHTFTIEDLDVDTRLKSGETKVIKITPDTAGEFRLKCTIPGHEQLGMSGTIIVE